MNAEKIDMNNANDKGGLMNKPNNLGTYSKIGLVLVLAAAFLVGMVGVAGATQPSGASAPINVTYVVHNDSDSGYTGYWALDNYTQHLTIWNLGGDRYQVNVTDTGIFCTFAGATSPALGVVEPSNGCGIMTGGYDGNLTTSAALTNQSATTIGNGIINFGGTKAGVLADTPADTVDAYASWINYFFPGANGGLNVNSNTWPNVFAFANSGNGWSWTYTLPNGAKWTDAGVLASPGTGDIVTSSQTGSSVGATAQIAQTADTCSVSPSSSGISFDGVVSGGPEVAASPSPVTVTNGGNVNGELFLSGGDWYLNAYSGVGQGQINVSATQWQISPGPYSGDWFNLQPVANPQDTGSSIAAGDSANLYFQLGVPATVPSGTYGQTITLATSC